MEGRIKKRIKEVSLVSLLLAMLFTNNCVHAIKNLEIRELDADFLDITEVNEAKDSIYKTEDIQKMREESEIVKAPVLQGGISELRAIVGKSRIFRFDEPLKKFSITNPKFIEMMFLSPKEILVNGKEAGETTVIIWGMDGEPVFFNLFVEKNNINFIKEVKRIAPNENIQIDFVDSGGESGLQVVLKGKVSSSILMEKIDKIATAYGYEIIDLTETLTPQVLLEVKIVEMAKSTNKSKSFEFKQGLFDYLSLLESSGLADTQATLMLGTETYDAPWYRDVAWKDIVDTTKDVLFAGTDDAGNKVYSSVTRYDNNGSLGGNSFADGTLSIWKAYPNDKLAYKLSRAEGEGIIKILAEPRVMVTHKETATFKSGQEVPVPDGQDQLGNTIFAYRDVGIKVKITPHVYEETQRVLLDIYTEISDLSTTASVGEAPGFSSKNSETVVEVENNHTTVITGLERQSESTTVTKFPFLSNLPVIGKLFDSTTASKDETEVMIFVTPTIVKADLARED